MDADRGDSRPLPLGPIQLIAVDLDETLLRPDLTLSPATTEAVRLAVQRGVRVVLATGRPPRTVQHLAQELGVDGWHIFHNGALIYDLAPTQIVRHLPLKGSLARQVIETARQCDPSFVVGVEVIDALYTDAAPKALGTMPALAGNANVAGRLDPVLESPVTKVMILGQPMRVAHVQTVLSSRFNQQIAFAMSQMNVLQVVHPEVDKAAALTVVAEHYGIDRRAVMAIGDAANDESMIRWAGLGIAVANAWEPVLQAAHFVVPSNQDDGVAQAIYKYVL